MAVILAALLVLACATPGLAALVLGSSATRQCPQYRFSPPLANLSYFESDTFAQLSISRLSKAITFPTISYDDFGEPEPKLDELRDPRWLTFPPFHKYLRYTFPLVHQQAHVETVGGYSLLYTLHGTTQAPPLMLTAHQDVVGVTDVDDWVHPPFEGVFDGVWMWGRGSSDCKSNLIGILSALERLLETGFVPRRTILLAFGQDEEAHGKYGSARLAKVIENRYGSHGIAMILDEGGSGLSTEYGPLMALPALAEKGYVDVAIRVRTASGHSSVPRKHTSIGLLSRFIAQLEDANIYQPKLQDENPFYDYLQCVAAHGRPELVPLWLPELLQQDDLEVLASRLVKEDEALRYLMQTSKAATVVSGGVKNNVLPPESIVVFNSRIELSSSADEHIALLQENLLPVARTYNLSLVSYGQTLLNGTQGIVELEVRSVTEPSPITPTDSHEWASLSTSIRAVFGTDTIVSPSLATSNTDTKNYWNISTNIFRWTPARIGTRLNAHGVNERVQLSTHIEGVKLYHELILRMDTIIL